MTTEVMNPQDVRDLQVIVPEWMEKILKEAEFQEKRVLVTRQHTPFGTYTIDIVIVEEETKGRGETSAFDI
ncbi:MAG: hypothetical protein IPL32_17910 [Chloracidobacterium sp.]|nr:hypothetical protein [Chloracidobacterium sp.]